MLNGTSFIAVEVDSLCGRAHPTSSPISGRAEQVHEPLTFHHFSVKDVIFKHYDESTSSQANSCESHKQLT